MKTIDYQNPFYSVSKEDYQLPNGYRGVYYGIRGLVTVFVVPQLSDTEFVILRQYRYLYDSYILEFAAGRVEVGESLQQAAARELEEETGYRAGRLVSAGWFGPCMGISDERCHVFLAKELTPTGQKLDQQEDIVVQTIQRVDFERLIAENKIVDGMTLAAWQCIQAKL